MVLKAIALNCTLKRGSEPSSTDKLLSEVCGELRASGVETEIVRVADLNILPGVTSDEGPGDEWPALRQNIVAADILVIGSPIWLGQPSSVAKRVLERLDSFLGESDEKRHMPSQGKVAVVGNEDGAHHATAEFFQALNDVGFTVPAGASTYWFGEAMGKVDYKDLPKQPGKTAATTKALAVASAHLASLLKSSPFPPLK